MVMARPKKALIISWPCLGPPTCRAVPSPIIPVEAAEAPGDESAHAPGPTNKHFSSGLG